MSEECECEALKISLQERQKYQDVLKCHRFAHKTHPTMVNRRTPLFSFLFGAWILVHLNVFSSLKQIADSEVACVGEECKALLQNENIRGRLQDAHTERVNQQHLKHESLQPSITNNQEPVHLVYAADDDDDSIKGVEQSIKSVMHFASEPVVFHFIGDKPLPSLPDVHYYNLNNVTIQFKLKDFTNPKKRFGKKRKTLNSSLANYVRFVMDSLLPNVSKAMWIDADTIVKCDIVPMVRNALTTTNYTVAAVGIQGRPQSLSRLAQKMYKGIEQTFNAGVFVVDLDRWRDCNMTDKIRKLSLLNKQKKLYRLGSQPPMTLVIGNEFEHLPPAWNVKVPLVKEYFNEYGNHADVCLLHWVGGRKPWETKQNLRSTHKEWWHKYRDKTPITRKSLNVKKK